MGAGFGRLVRSEWTKLRTVRRWVVALGVMVVLIISFGMLVSSGSSTDVNKRPYFSVGPDGTAVSDRFEFVHQPFAGDGSVTVRVLTQANSHEWAGAGLMIKDGTRSGAPYAAVMVTPKHGVRLGANFTTDVAGGPVSTPRWLRLTRSGPDITADESADGVAWQRVGTVSVPQLPATAEVGLFVASPPKIKVERSPGGTSVGQTDTQGSATFDRLSAEFGSARPSAWQATDVHRPPLPEEVATEREVPPGSPKKPPRDERDPVTEVGGVFTVNGAGMIGPDEAPDDLTQATLFGVLIGLLVIAAISVLFITSEFRLGMIRTTLAASSTRGRVLAAKALVLGGVAFVLGLIAGVTSFLIGQPLMRRHGFGPPAFAEPSLTQPGVLRALFGTAAFVALVAVFGLGVGAILRRSAGAITTVITLVVLPVFVAVALPGLPARWLLSVTPAGGFAMQRAKPPTDQLAEPWSMLNPWIGLGAVAVYAAVALAVGAWMLRRRDA